MLPTIFDSLLKLAGKGYKIKRGRNILAAQMEGMDWAELKTIAGTHLSPTGLKLMNSRLPFIREKKRFCYFLQGNLIGVD